MRWQKAERRCVFSYFDRSSCEAARGGHGYRLHSKCRTNFVSFNIHDQETRTGPPLMYTKTALQKRARSAVGV